MTNPERPFRFPFDGGVTREQARAWHSQSKREPVPKPQDDDLSPACDGLILAALQSAWQCDQRAEGMFESARCLWSPKYDGPEQDYLKRIEGIRYRYLVCLDRKREATSDK